MGTSSVSYCSRTHSGKLEFSTVRAEFRKQQSLPSGLDKFNSDGNGLSYRISFLLCRAS